MSLVNTLHRLVVGCGGIPQQRRRPFPIKENDCTTFNEKAALIAPNSIFISCLEHLHSVKIRMCRNISQIWKISDSCNNKAFWCRVLCGIQESYSYNCTIKKIFKLDKDPNVTKALMLWNRKYQWFHRHTDAKQYGKVVFLQCLGQGLLLESGTSEIATPVCKPLDYWSYQIWLITVVVRSYKDTADKMYFTLWGTIII